MFYMLCFVLSQGVDRPSFVGTLLRYTNPAPLSLHTAKSVERASQRSVVSEIYAGIGLRSCQKPLIKHVDTVQKSKRDMTSRSLLRCICEALGVEEMVQLPRLSRSTAVRHADGRERSLKCSKHPV